MKKITLFVLSVAFAFLLNSSFAQDRGQETDPQIEKLLRLAETFQERQTRQKAEAETAALENGWSVRLETESGESEIQYLDESGMPQYYATYNLNAARTTGTNQLWPGGTTGLDLNGDGYLIGIWDGGGVRTAHQEFGSRVAIMDGAALSNHGTHVGGTMVASGVQNAARGMAGQATLRSYDWTDDYTEMATEASGGLTLSNHSYGQVRGWAWGNWAGGSNAWHWFGNPTISATEDYRFGFYDNLSQSIDQIAYDAPKYLIVWAAANDRNDDASGGHWVWSGGSWTWSTASRDPDGGTDGFDCIPQQGVAKNILTVGAVNDITSGYSGPSSVVMTDFSSWGPADDGRIKPDIVANGASLYSTSSGGNTSYTTMSGTSMASPNVTGSLALLQEHYRALRNDITSATMSAASLKGLVINTAHEAGPNDGPDYMFGWGLLNAVGAAEKITQDDLEGGLIVEGVLNNGQTIDYTYYNDGSEINATIIWTDPAGTPPAASLNPTTNMLVNDLDFRVIGSSTYLPWQANRTFPSSPAYKSDNTRDNLETVNVKNPAPGYYTLRITHKGTLVGSQQAYSMIITGLSTPTNETYCKARASSSGFEKITRVQMGSINNYSDRAPGGYMDYRGRVTQISKGGSQGITVTLTGGATDSWGRVYVDWNQDGDFNDAGEAIFLGSGAGPAYSTTINVPASALGGYTTMRVRIGWSGTPSPCGQVSFGEAEDYTIKVLGTSGLWTGTVSSDWFDPKNWDDGFVPTSTVNVTIPSTAPYQPVIGGSQTAYCNNLVIQSGALLTQNSTSYFYVYGNFDSDAGQFIMNGNLSYLYFAGSTNTWWDDDNENDTYTNVRVVKDTPTTQVMMWQDMTCSGSFEIREGRFAIDASWTLTVTSISNNAFEVEDGGILRLAPGKSISVVGGVRFYDGSQSDITGGTISCGGNFRIDDNTSYDIELTETTLILDGAGSQLLQDYDGNSIHHLVISKPSGTATINGANLSVAGNLTIDGGTFSLGSQTCNVAGTTNINNGGALAMNDAGNNLTTPVISWNSGSNTNITAGTFNISNIWGFNEGTNAQIGSGNTAYVNNMYFPSDPDAHFGNLVVSPGGVLLSGDLRATYPVNVAGNLTIKNGANWTFPGPSGMVVSGNSLIESGASLSFNTNAVFNTAGSLDISGTLDLNSGASALLNGALIFPSTGFLSISNGSFISDLPDTGNWTNILGTLNISSGLFELSNNHPRFTASTVTNISGGIFRIGGAFNVQDPGIFQPTGGTFEIAGNNANGAVYFASGNHFYNLVVNRGPNLHSWFVTGDPVEIQNNFTVENGMFRSGSVAISVLGNTTINSDGVLALDGVGSLLMGASRSLTVNNGGLLELNGTITDQPKISRISSGNYAFNVESGGTIAAEFALFEHMNTNGVNLKPGAIVDHSRAFHNSIFRNGQSGGRLLTINNNQTFTVNYANFPNNTWGGNFNVYKTADAGLVTFGGFSGLFSGEANEWDPYSRIHWGGEIAPNVTLEGVEISDGQDMCFEATNTLTVGGGGSTFLVQNGGNANLVAGQKVVMLDGTRVFSGGNLHARITTTSDYCSLPAPLLAVVEEKQSTLEAIAGPETSESFFKVYPNPTTGMFTLELSEIASTVTVEIYGVMGEQILRQEVSGFTMYEFDLSAQARGIYIVRVLNGDKMEIQRVIRQ